MRQAPAFPRRQLIDARRDQDRARKDGLDVAIAIDSIAAWCNPHCASVAAALNPAHTTRYPSPNSSTAADPRRSPRLAFAAANSSSIGAADTAIIPTIITTHIANVRKVSAVVHGMSIGIPIAAIILSCSMSDDI